MPRSKSRKRSKKAAEPVQNAILFYYKDGDGDVFLCGNKNIPRYSNLFYDNNMREVIQEFCNKDAKEPWVKKYLKDELFAPGCDLAKDKTKIVLMISCYVDKKTEEKNDQPYAIKDIRVTSILLGHYYGKINEEKTQGIYINLVASGKNESARTIMNYFLFVFFDKYYYRRRHVGGDETEVDEEDQEKTLRKKVKEIRLRLTILCLKQKKIGHKSKPAHTQNTCKVKHRLMRARRKTAIVIRQLGKLRKKQQNLPAAKVPAQVKSTFSKSWLKLKCAVNARKRSKRYWKKRR